MDNMTYIAKHSIRFYTFLKKVRYLLFDQYGYPWLLVLSLCQKTDSFLLFI